MRGFGISKTGSRMVLVNELKLGTMCREGGRGAGQRKANWFVRICIYVIDVCM